MPRIRWPASLACWKTLNSVCSAMSATSLSSSPIAQVGPIAAEPLHHVVVVEPGQGELELLAAELPGHRGDQDLHRRGHVVVVDERHLDVELGEFGLPVGAKVFVAEAAGDLEIAVEARDHQELLVKLGRLGQRIEMAGMDPAGDQEVARSLGRAAAQDRRLDLEEAQLRHRAPHELRQPVAEDEDLLHRRPAQVEVAIGQPQLFVGLGPVHLERRRRRGVVDDQLLDADLDPAGLELGVLLAAAAAGRPSP